jgi:NTP pyrophosphatase (non-canonical NTP hydrolase)
MNDRILKQKAEFDAVFELVKAYNSLPQVVDDDYPEMRHYYEGAMRTLIDKLRDNGRISVQGALNQLARECHEANQKWWHDPETGARLDRNKGELLMLIVSEVSECMEGERKDLMDNHLPNRKMAEVELADILIRVFDYAGAFGYDLDGAVVEKRMYNAKRADHTAEARLRADGKKW